MVDIVIAACVNLEGNRIVLIQSGRSYLVSAAHHKECKHDKGFTLEEVKSGLYGYSCNHRCGYVCSFSPDKFPDGVAYVEHQPSPEDRVIKLSEGGKY